MNILLKFYKISQKIKKTVLSIWLSYLAGVSVEYISNATSFLQLIYSIFDFSKISVLILWSGAAIVALIWSFNFVFANLQVSNQAFISTMREHTYEVLNRSELSTYSWGYNKALCIPKSSEGWKPEDVYIDFGNSHIDGNFSFNEEDSGLKGYNDEAYISYCNTSEKINIIRNRGDDQDRYGILHFERSMVGNRLELRLQKSKWSQLQFSWDYLRRLDVHNKPVMHPSRDEQIDQSFVNALNRTGNLLINSFCLHLILVSKEGKLILSRISKTKSNDYPSTWAATLGEQIERKDFIDSSNGNPYPNFVIRWVKRALKEELGIDEGLSVNEGISELDKYVDMESLRALSLDFEGDIYNVALTCFLRLRINADELRALKEIQLDSNELTNDFKECTDAEVREILLGYPDNQDEYHPSTYLRLLMFHRYKNRYLGTVSSIMQDYKKTKKTH